MRRMARDVTIRAVEDPRWLVAGAGLMFSLLTAWLSRSARNPEPTRRVARRGRLALERLEDRVNPSVGFAIGGGPNDVGVSEANGVAVDAVGNIYVTGRLTDKTTVGGTVLNASNGPTFVAKFTNDGALVWVDQYGKGSSASGFAQGYNVAVDGAGNVYVSGFFGNADVDFDPGPGTHPVTSGTNGETYVLKLTPTGQFGYLAHMGAGPGGVTPGNGGSLVVDPSGNVYAAGQFHGSNVNFDPSGSGPDNLTTSHGGNDFNGYVVKLTTAGGFGGVAVLGSGGSSCLVQGLALDGDGNVYATGHFSGANASFDPGNPGAHTLSSSHGGSDVNGFVAKLNPSLQFGYAALLGYGSSFSGGVAVAVDGSGNAYATGSFKGTAVNFDPSGTGPDALSSSNGGSDTNAFVVKLTPTGQLGYATLLGYGSSNSYGTSIAVDPFGSLYVAGAFTGTNVNFDPGGSGPHDLTAVYRNPQISGTNGTNEFVVKLTPSAGFDFDAVLGYGGQIGPYGIRLDASGNLITAGWYSGINVNFDLSGSGPHNLTSAGNGYSDYRSWYLVRATAQLTVGPDALPDWTQGVSYSQQVTVGGGNGSYTFSVTPGTLPPGLLVNTTTGAITGTPTAAGTYSFSIGVKDTNGLSGFHSYTVTINAPVTLDTATLADWTQGLPGYRQTLAASHGTGAITFAVQAGDDLPAGLALDATSGLISGTPTAKGTFTFHLVAADSVGASATRSYTVTIAAPVAITTTTLTDWDKDLLGYSQAVQATGGTGTLNYSLGQGGQLPPGLALYGTTGLVSGTPTTTGSFTFHVTATDTVGASDTHSYTVTIAAPVAITTARLSDWTEGVGGYRQTVSASDGTGAVTFAVQAGDSLPPGLTLDGNAGVISGTPTARGVYTFHLVATDAPGDSDTLAYTVTINAPVTLDTATLADWTQGLPGYRQTLAASHGTGAITFAVQAGDDLPAGLALDATSGLISGTPTAKGTFTFHLVAADSVGASATRSYTVTIAAPVAITTTTLTDWDKDLLGYSQAVQATGGTGTLNYSLGQGGQLPPGLALYGTTGLVSGTPTTTGSFTFHVTATDTVGASDTRSFTVTINTPPAIATTQLSDWTLGIGGYRQTVAASGGTGALSFGLASSDHLPAGLSLDPSTGAITGKPTAAGRVTFHVVVTDAVGGSAGRAFAVTIESSFAVTDFKGYGLYRYTAAAGWQPLYTPDTDAAKVDAAGDVVADFAGYGFYRYTAAGGWHAFRTPDPASFQLDAAGDIVADFSGYGLYRYTAVAVWQALGTPDAAAYVVNAAGTIAASFSGAGLYLWTAAAGWQSLGTPDTNVVRLDDAGDVIADFAGYGLYRHTAAGWLRLGTPDTTLVVVAGGGAIVADFAGYGLYLWTAGGGWASLHTPDASAFAMDAAGDVVADFAGAGLHRYTAAGGWERFYSPDPSVLAVDAAGDIWADFPGYGLHLYRPGVGWVRFFSPDVTSVRLSS
jgi:hypothetical protein